MERTELINAMRMIKDHCENLESCQECEIRNLCDDNFPIEPYTWDLDGDL